MRIDRNKKFRTLEEELLILQEEGKHKSLSIAEILRVLSGKGRPLILILLSLPFCQPIPLPGLSIPFGIAIAFIGLRMILGKRIWLPKKILKKNISSHTLNKITEKALNLTRKMKPWIHPRLIWLCRSSFMEKSNGFMIFMLGTLLALPIPVPLSNMPAAWSTLFIAFGVLEDDIIFICTGYALSLLTLALFVVLGLSLTNYFFM